jgi:hypothetical protein
MSHTFRYKNGFINVSTLSGSEVIRAMVDQFAYAIEVKSVHAAKILITKHEARK